MNKRVIVKKKSNTIFSVLNVLDLTIIMFVTVVIAAVLLRSRAFGLLGEHANDLSLEVTVMSEPRPRDSIMMVNAGDVLRDAVSEDYIGRIKSVTVKPYFSNIVTLTGEIVLADDPSGIILDIVFETTGKNSDRGILLRGNKFAAPGTVLELHNDKLSFKGTVISIAE